MQKRTYSYQSKVNLINYIRRASDADISIYWQYYKFIEKSIEKLCQYFQYPIISSVFKIRIIKIAN